MYSSKIIETKIFWILILSLLILVFWFPTRNIPYWWDSAGYIVHAARYYINTNFTSLLLPSDSAITAFAHPPFFVFTLALVWKIFGESLLISHIFYLIFILLAVIFTYLLGKKIANFENELINHLVGVSAALFLLFSPVFLAQTGIIYPEIPVTAFAVMTIYYFLDKKPWLYLLSASLMLLTKETSAILIVAIAVAILLEFLIKFFRKEKSDFKKAIKESIIYGSPIILLVTWFIWHKMATGWMFVMPYYQETLTKGALSLSKIILPAKFFFLEQFRFIITFSILGLFLFHLFDKEKRCILKRLDIILLSLIIVFVILLFGIVDFLHRYIVFGLPFLFILFSYFIGQTLINKKTAFVFLTIIILFIFSFGWNNHRKIKSWHFPPLEENLEYLDIIKIGQKTASFIEKNYPDQVVYTAFPTNYMLSEPFQHYVSKPIETRDCKDYKEGDRIDLIVFHFFSPGQIDCMKLIGSLGFQNLVTFEENGKFIQIYRKPY